MTGSPIGLPVALAVTRLANTMSRLCAELSRRDKSTGAAQLAQAAPERKMGVKHAEVVTVRLVQDEDGWLRLAG